MGEKFCFKSLKDFFILLSDLCPIQILNDVEMLETPEIENENSEGENKEKLILSEDAIMEVDEEKNSSSVDSGNDAEVDAPDKESETNGSTERDLNLAESEEANKEQTKSTENDDKITLSIEDVSDLNKHSDRTEETNEGEDSDKKKSEVRGKSLEQAENRDIEDMEMKETTDLVEDKIKITQDYALNAEEKGEDGVKDRKKKDQVC